MKEVLPMTPLGADRYHQLVHITRRYESLLKVVGKRPNKEAQVTDVNIDGDIVSFDVNRHFLFGMYRIRKALQLELVALGHKDLVMEVNQTYGKP